jgi:hypothetical protein
MRYQVGDTVRVIKTDYPELPVGTISKVVWSNTSGLDLLAGNKRLTFWNHEVEPYKEEVRDTKIEVGDTVEITSKGYYSYELEVGDKAIVTSINDAGVCELNFTEIATRKGNLTYYQCSEPDFKDLKLVAKAKANMESDIEVGDIINGKSYNNNRVTQVCSDHYMAINLAEEAEGSADEFWIRKENAVLVSKANNMKSIIEVGDKVKYNDGDTYFGMEYHTVKSIVGTKVHYVEGGFDEISTLEVFEKAAMKEVIGYKLAKSEYKAAALAIIGEDDFRNDPGIDVSVPSNIQKYRNAGVLDLWFEPVYKSSEVTIKLSKSRKAIITNKTLATIVLADGSKFQAPAEAISKVLKALNSLATIAGYRPEFKEFQLGCQTFTIADLQAVHKAFTDFK